MRLIDADIAIDVLDKTCDRVCEYPKKQRAVMCRSCPLAHAFDVIEELPTVDVVEVIRCKDCKYSIDFYDEGDCYCRRPDRGLEWVGDWDFYCKAAERRENG